MSETFKLGDKVSEPGRGYADGRGNGIPVVNAIMTVVKVGARVTTSDGRVWYVSHYAGEWRVYGRGHGSGLRAYRDGDDSLLALGQTLARRNQATMTHLVAGRRVAETQRQIDDLSASIIVVRERHAEAAASCAALDAEIAALCAQTEVPS